LRMKAKALRTAGPAVRTRRFGALGGGAASDRGSESQPGERALGREAKFLRGRWDVGPPSLANAGNGAWQTSPAAKANRTSEASAIECESMAMGGCRRISSAKAETDSIRRRRGAIPGGRVAYGNGAALASSQRWVVPGTNTGNRVGLGGAHADSGLRRNRSPKTRKGRERNLEPDRTVSLGRALGSGTELGEPGRQPSGWNSRGIGNGPKGRNRSLPVSTGEHDQ